MKRLVKPELLDSLPPDDPAAQHSRRDLRRVNAWMRNHSIMARAIKTHSPDSFSQITELGAGDGNFLLRVAQKLPMPDVQATLLDLQKNISGETLAGFQKINWHAQPVVADVFDWLQKDESSSEIIIANLFLHHFKDARLAELLQKISTRTRLLVAVEPRRIRFPFAGAQLLRFIGCNHVTLHDAEVSIRAGFVRDELSTLWPDAKNWRLTEHRAGIFSHLFLAQKIS